MDCPPLPRLKKNREIGKKYSYSNRIVIWTGKKLNCVHHKVISACRLCKGSSICIHNKYKRKCRDCSKDIICKHSNQKIYCKNCKYGEKCIHDKHKKLCLDCGGNNICEHEVIRRNCIKCNKKKMCIHGKNKRCCFDCGGDRMCEHRKYKEICKICIGSQICPHRNRKNNCLECKITCAPGDELPTSRECFIPFNDFDFNLLTSEFYTYYNHCISINFFNVSSTLKQLCCNVFATSQGFNVSSMN